MRFIDPAGRRVNRSDDSVGVIDHSVIFIPWPSFESVLTNQGGFWIGVALILLVYFRTRTWFGHIRVLIVIGLVLFSVCFVELLSLFTAGSSDLIQSRGIQLTNRIQRCVGIDSAAVGMDLSALYQTCSDALRHDTAEECNENILPPALAGFAQDAVIRNRVVQAITQKPHVIESFRDNPHQLSFATHVIQKQ